LVVCWVFAFWKEGEEVSPLFFLKFLFLKKRVSGFVGAGEDAIENEKSWQDDDSEVSGLECRFSLLTDVVVMNGLESFAPRSQTSE
jgi:hypothetical protein